MDFYEASETITIRHQRIRFTSLNQRLKYVIVFKKKSTKLGIARNLIFAWFATMISI